MNMTETKWYTLYSKNMKDCINIGVNGFEACRSCKSTLTPSASAH